MFLVGDETKHMVLFIFYALCMCLTVEDCIRDIREKEFNPV